MGLTVTRSTTTLGSWAPPLASASRISMWGGGLVTARRRPLPSSRRQHPPTPVSLERAGRRWRQIPVGSRRRLTLTRYAHETGHRALFSNKEVGRAPPIHHQQESSSLSPYMDLEISSKSPLCMR